MMTMTLRDENVHVGECLFDVVVMMTAKYDSRWYLSL